MDDEVLTHYFIEKWSSHKEIILPVVVEDELELRAYSGTADLVTGAFGIKEPVGHTFTDYNKIDLAIIPGMAFDHSGNRLGRGKGYYDKLLPKLKATKAGVCFPFQVMDEVPADEFDVKMDMIFF